MRPAAKTAWLIGFALVVFTAAVYHRAFGLGFVYDDRSYLLESGPMLAGVSAAAMHWAFTSFHHSNWQPLAVISTLVDVKLFGLDPAGHHGVNLLFHSGNAVLLFLVLRRLTGTRWRPALVAALFALHPLNVETVAWVTERSNLLSLFFCLFTLLAYLRYAARPGPARFALVAGLYALGLLSKPMLVTLPFLLLLLDLWPLGRMGFPAGARQLGRLTLEKVPLFLLSLADAAVTLKAQMADGAVQSLEGFPFAGRAANAVTAYAAYLSKTFWPAGLAVFYPYRGVRIPIGEILASTALLVVIGAVALRTWRRRPYLAIGWFWYLGLLVPVIGLVQVGRQAMADRYAYLPLLGVFLALAWLLADFAEKSRARRTAVGAAVAIALGAGAVLSAVQVEAWRDEITLFRHAVGITTDNEVAQNNLGAALQERGRNAEAAARFREALRLRPGYADAHVGLGEALVRMGQPGEGIRQIREGLRLEPDSARFRVNLGAALAGVGRQVEAEALYREALQRQPDLHLAHMNLANLLADTGRVGEALAHYTAAARLNPRDADVPFNRGITLAEQRRYAEAAAAFREALRLQPNYEEARQNLAALAKSPKR